MKHDIFDTHTGKVKLARTGTEEKRRRHRDTFGRDNDDQRLIDFCLQCTKKKCNGNCYEYSLYESIINKRKKCKYCGSYLIDHNPKNLYVFCPTCNIIKPLEEIMEV